jgi:hypothetical protein
MIGSRGVVSSYSSATAPESHGNSSHRSTDQTHKELPPEVAACACGLKVYFAAPGLLKERRFRNRLFKKTAVANRRSLKLKACAWASTTYLSEMRIAASFRDVFL